MRRVYVKCYSTLLVKTVWFYLNDKTLPLHTVWAKTCCSAGSFVCGDVISLVHGSGRTGTMICKMKVELKMELPPRKRWSVMWIIFFSLLAVARDVIYPTRNIVFDHIYKQREESWKHDIDELWSVWKCDQTLQEQCLECLTYLLSRTRE